MSIAAIRESRGVPAKIGGRVRYTGSADGKPREGTIIGTRGGYLRIRLDGAKVAGSYHPTWELEYLDAAKTEKRPEGRWSRVGVAGTAVGG